MTSVDVSRDLAHAPVYVTLLGDPAERAERVAELNHAAPLLRRELGRRMHIRTVPKLEFRYDEVVERAAQLSALIDAPWPPMPASITMILHQRMTPARETGVIKAQPPSGQWRAIAG
jgi:hypothetical protein